ncbi:von Willebrand factor type A domain-containing protein [Parapedobacter deserti]|uniref:von Willebrand factor type A domain-containing protein n=1 Tax=Parapedobacter deserti TaxID=1912957 RepID=A0ABV7JMZ6_9SPHI
MWEGISKVNAPLESVTVVWLSASCRTTPCSGIWVSWSITLPVIAFGYETKRLKVGKQDKLDVRLVPSAVSLDEVVVVGHGTQERAALTGGARIMIRGGWPPKPAHTESYKRFAENRFFNPLEEPLSTFAIDVDAASYSNFRRFINSGQLPPTDAVRIEEMVNYFRYDLEGPANGEPVATHTELAAAPWNPQHCLLRVGLKAKPVPNDKLPASNLVFLIDVSGSMAGENRLPLAQASMKMLVDQLCDNDHVAIVTYAGSAGVALESTSGSRKTKIKDAIDALGAVGLPRAEPDWRWRTASRGSTSLRGATTALYCPPTGFQCRCLQRRRYGAAHRPGAAERGELVGAGFWNG